MTSIRELEAAVGRSERAIVAFSGGVDSSLVAAMAARVLGERALAVTAVSPALATGELDGARTVASAVGIAHEVIRTDELSREGYRRNGPTAVTTASLSSTHSSARSRQLGGSMRSSPARTSTIWVTGGRVCGPRQSTGSAPARGGRFGKAEVRALAHELGLPSADKPAMPCLASRLPFGTEVDPDVLALVDRAERAVKALGFRELRVRHLGPTGRVEIGADELDRALAEDRVAIEEGVLSAGYTSVEIEPEPFRSGRLTRGLRSPLPIVGVGAESRVTVARSQRTRE